MGSIRSPLDLDRHELVAAEPALTGSEANQVHSPRLVLAADGVKGVATCPTIRKPIREGHANPRRRPVFRVGDPISATGTVCATHGGSAPQVRAKADERLRALQPPAVIRLEDGLNAIQRQLDRHGLVVDVGPDHAIRVRAATAILDRTGMGPSQSVNVSHEASQRFVALLQELDEPQVKQVENEASETYEYRQGQTTSDLRKRSEGTCD